MREKFLKTGSLIVDKVTGEKLFVRAVFPSVFRVSVVNEDGSIGDEMKEVDKKDLILFRYLRDMQEPEIPDVDQFSLVGGILYKDGSPVTEQGSLRFDAILGAIKNNELVLSAETPDRYTSDQGDLILYDIRKDRFVNLNISTDDLVVARKEGPFLAFRNDYRTEAQKNEQTGELETKNVFVSATLACEKNGDFVSRKFILGEIKEAFYSEKQESLVVLFGENQTAIMPWDPYSKTITFKGLVSKVTYVNGYMTAQMGTGVIVATPDEDDDIKMLTNLPELNNFYAVDIDNEGMYFVNDQRRIMKLIETVTEDRGNIYKLVDVN